MSCEPEGRERTHLTGNRADEKRKQRGVRKKLMPTDQCGPIQTDAERTLFFILYQDLACKNHDGSDNFLVMAGRLNQEYSKQVRHVLNQVLTAGSHVLAMPI